MASDSTCPICQAGYQSRCAHVEYVGAGGAQAEMLRVPLADGTLVATSATPPHSLVPDLLAASDVLGTAWFAAAAAEAGPAKTVVVVGDGAVGLLAVLAARQLGAEQGLPGLSDPYVNLCGFSADKGLDNPDKLRCVLEPEGVAGIVKQNQLRAGHAAG